VTVRLHVWRVRPTAVPRAMWGMAVDRRGLRRDAAFVKLLGTGRGGEFGAGKADLTRWAALIVGDPAVTPPMRGAVARCVITLEPIASRGTWAGREPFDTRTTSKNADMIAVLTRARLKARKAPAFWKAIDPDSRARSASGALRRMSCVSRTVSPSMPPSWTALPGKAGMRRSCSPGSACWTSPATVR